MATILTHNLLKCNKLTTMLPGINNPGFIPFDGLVVRLDNDNSKTYTVRKNVQGRFYHPFEDTGVDFSVVYDVTSMKFNGAELISSAISSSWGSTTPIFTSFPYYTLGNEYLYTNNKANGITVGEDTTGLLGFGTNNFYYFVEQIVDSFNLPVKVSKSPSLWWFIDGEPRLNNFTLEKYYSDSFEFTMTETITNYTTPGVTSRVHRYVFGVGSVTHFIDGVDVTTYTGDTEWPQYSEVNSFYSYDLSYDTIEQIDLCPVYDSFNTSLSTGDCTNISISCDCKKITFSDTTNYESNGLVGHDAELFTSRTIVMTRPDGSTYTWGTSDVSVKDELIQPHYSSTNNFQYSFGPNDIDGIYEIKLCTYPDWTPLVQYEAYTQTIVRRNGTLYKVTTSNTNIDPSSAGGSTYWTEYICNGNCTDTRYCVTEKVVVLCISLLKCYKKLVKDAFCGMESNPCKSMCDNKEFMQAMKFRVALDALEFAVCSNDWVSAKKHLDLLKSLCCCNG